MKEKGKHARDLTRTDFLELMKITDMTLDDFDKQ